MAEMGLIDFNEKIPRTKDIFEGIGSKEKFKFQSDNVLKIYEKLRRIIKLKSTQIVWMHLYIPIF